MNDLAAFALKYQLCMWHNTGLASPQLVSCAHLYLQITELTPIYSISIKLLIHYGEI